MNDDILKMAREAGFETKRDMVFVDSWEITRSIERLVALVRAAEREACATRLEAIGCDHCAANIRARSK